MSTAMPFDEDLTRRLVEMYTTREVVAQRDATLEILNPQLGERVLDIGSGPGFLAAGIASRVGESGAVSGIDLSEPMIAYASGFASGTGLGADDFRARRRNGARLPRSELRRGGLDPGLRVRAGYRARRWPRSTGCSFPVGGC